MVRSRSYVLPIAVEAGSAQRKAENVGIEFSRLHVSAMFQIVFAEISCNEFTDAIDPKPGQQ
jgi:hypothetical protein